MRAALRPVIQTPGCRESGRRHRAGTLRLARQLNRRCGATAPQLERAALVADEAEDDAPIDAGKLVEGHDALERAERLYAPSGRSRRAGSGAAGATCWTRDDKSEMLIIYGHEKNLPPLDPSAKGHFHAESAEFWLVFSGRIRYAFEGQEPFIANEGDVVYVPSSTWHATRFIGDNACRLSITEYVGNALLLEQRKPVP
jgi:mannose-6-phosphate isomerase-like protein (cupin superfamily)